MFIHHRSSLKNYTRFQTKMGKVFNRFQTKTAQLPKYFSKAVSKEMYHQLNCPKIIEQFSVIRASQDINFLQI